ncbi:unnamed protein product [Malus baccata var. baccata]
MRLQVGCGPRAIQVQSLRCVRAKPIYNGLLLAVVLRSRRCHKRQRRAWITEVKAVTVDPRENETMEDGWGSLKMIVLDCTEARKVVECPLQVAWQHWWWRQHALGTQ